MPPRRRGDDPDFASDEMDDDWSEGDDADDSDGDPRPAKVRRGRSSATL
jgi:hypothetical protein